MRDNALGSQRDMKAAHTGRKYRLIQPEPPHIVSQHYLMLFFDITPFLRRPGARKSNL